jgi:predicted transposase YbfD/YdcC
LPFARSATAVERTWLNKNQPESAVKAHTRYFLSTLDHQETKRIPAAIRGHWSIENLNHYKRDTCLWREDDHRHRRVPIAQNLALTRNALLSVIPFTADQPLASCFERYQRSPAQAIQLILHARPVA